MDHVDFVNMVQSVEYVNMVQSGVLGGLYVHGPKLWISKRGGLDWAHYSVLRFDCALMDFGYGICMEATIRYMENKLPDTL